MKTTKRKKGRPLLLAAAGATALVFAGCGSSGGNKIDMGPSGNLLGPPQDLSVPDSGPSGNLLAPPFDMSKTD